MEQVMEETTSLVQFGTSASVVTTSNAKSGAISTRLMSAKEYRTQSGLKGSAARREFNAYVRTHGKANTAGLAAQLTAGELLVTGFTDYKRSLTVRFAKASQIKDAKLGGASEGTPADVASLLEAMTAEERDALIAQFI